ncbi:zinc finger and BTB domain-containing protein 14-like [Onthophagus taurus]|uniref:zinc finger and BTB domain-containing protein 14-like n=1 Tax=Onthophagus taurus TaxID=166361 RepID=UPI000C2025D6|nr:zinc finger protein 792-like [Onthophagus taurus]XP_022901152.1 zinc finger protein 792-like [Onthophagus taurus]
MELNLFRSCRICSIAYENAINVFSDLGKKSFLQAKIKKYLHITVSLEDKLPKIICEGCYKRLEGFHKFATMANRTQDKFTKILINNNIAEQKKSENKGLLHSYLTKGTKEDIEVTEMEVRVDPMVFLQCTLEEDETSCESETMSSEEDKREVEKRKKPVELAQTSKLKRILVMNYNNLVVERDEEKTNVAHNEFKSERESDGEISERYNCPICAKVISTKGNLKVHLETHRPKGKYACDICGRIFKTQCNLHRHKEYHGGVQFPCSVCGRVYPTNSTLRAHSITHSNLRPHKCPLCDKTFKRNQDLKFHINQHTGARPYQCPYCPKAFASSGNCFSHRKRMHPVEVERDRERAASIIR